MEALIQPFFLVLITALAIYLPYFSLGDIVSPYCRRRGGGAIER